MMLAPRSQLLEIRWFRRAVGIVLLAIIAALDFAVGPEFVLAIAYLVPIIFSSWFLGRKDGIYTAALSWTAALHNAGVFTPELEHRPLIVAFNAITALVFFELTAWLVSGIRERQEQLQRMLDVDETTGAASPRFFYSHLQEEMYRLDRYGHPLTVVYLDVDNFKLVNDTRGHHEGDLALRTVVATIRDNIRAADFVARLGGDEFVILLPETDAPAAKVLLPKIQEKLLARVAKHEWPITFSIGVLTSLKSQKTEQVLRKADELMYEAKRSGKNKIVFQDR